MSLSIFLAIITTFLLVTGQILWKIGLEKVSFDSGYLTALSDILRSAPIIIGLIIYVGSTGLWFIVLKSADFSKVYPIMALSYIIGLVAAVIFFGEKVSLLNWFGALVILLGIILVTWKS